MRREMRQISGVNRPLGVALSAKAHGTVRRTVATSGRTALRFWRKATQCTMPNSAKIRSHNLLFPQKRVRWGRQLGQAFGRATFPFCHKAKQKSRPSAVKPPATHNLLPAKTCKLSERTAANFRAHGIALLAESNAVHNAEQCKIRAHSHLFPQKRVGKRKAVTARFPLCVQYPFPAKACEMGAAIGTGFRACNVSFLPQSKAEIQTLRRKPSGHA